MKNIILLLISTIFLNNLNAQKIRFSDTNNRWKTVSRSESNPGHVITTSYGDIRYSSRTITKNNKTYRALSDSRRMAWIHEDTVANIIYCINSTDGNFNVDTNEYVLFDYNLKTGDTFSSAIQPIDIPITAKCVVTNVDSIMLNNYWHKRFHLNYFQGSFTGTYIFTEGIGIGRPLTTLTGPCGCTLTPVFYSQFICFHQAGKVPQTDTGSLYDCDVTLNVGAINDLATLKIYPQPTTGEINIELPVELSHGILYIINNMGQIVSEQSFNNSSTIKYSNTNLHGLYYYKIADYDKSYQYTGRLLFE